MKNCIALSLALACTLSLQAQIKEGTIVYERKIDMHRSITDESMKAMIPQYQTGNYILVFKDSISSYKAAPKDEAPDPFEGGGGARVVIRVGGPGEDGVTYRNFNSRKLLQENTLEDKKYIVSDTIKTPAWKLADETKTILNHVCKKATMTNERGTSIVAWYAEDMPVPAGPDKFGGLPGMVLLVDGDNGFMTFTAIQIQDKADTKELKAPTGGKLITRADFEKKLDDVMGPADAQGRRMIRRN